MSIDAQGFAYVRDLVRANSGVVLESGKEYLVEARLRPLAEKAGLASVELFIQKLRAGSLIAMSCSVIEAMTTNETLFFRDMHPFETLRSMVLPDLIERRGGARALNIWSAACSTGQEPYSTAMILREHFPNLASWSCQIRASDIASKVLDVARIGRYRQLEVNRGVPARLLVKYFSREGTDWQVKPEIRAMVQFFELNLLRPWPVMPKMDVVFLRNILIYFAVETKRLILDAVRRQMAPNGYLLLGSWKLSSASTMDSSGSRMTEADGIVHASNQGIRNDRFFNRTGKH